MNEFGSHAYAWTNSNSNSIVSTIDGGHGISSNQNDQHIGKMNQSVIRHPSASHSSIGAGSSQGLMGSAFLNTSPHTPAPYDDQSSSMGRSDDKPYSNNLSTSHNVDMSSLEQQFRQTYISKNKETGEPESTSPGAVSASSLAFNAVSLLPSDHSYGDQVELNKTYSVNATTMLSTQLSSANYGDTNMSFGKNNFGFNHNHTPSPDNLSNHGYQSVSDVRSKLDDPFHHSMSVPGSVQTTPGYGHASLTSQTPMTSHASVTSTPIYSNVSLGAALNQGNSSLINSYISSQGSSSHADNTKSSAHASYTSSTSTLLPAFSFQNTGYPPSNLSSTSTLTSNALPTMSTLSSTAFHSVEMYSHGIDGSNRDGLAEHRPYDHSKEHEAEALRNNTQNASSSSQMSLYFGSREDRGTSYDISYISGSNDVGNTGRNNPVMNMGSQQLDRGMNNRDGLHSTGHAEYANTNSVVCADDDLFERLLYGHAPSRSAYTSMPPGQVSRDISPLSQDGCLLSASQSIANSPNIGNAGIISTSLISYANAKLKQNNMLSSPNITQNTNLSNNNANLTNNANPNARSNYYAVGNPSASMNNSNNMTTNMTSSVASNVSSNMTSNHAQNMPNVHSHAANVLPNSTYNVLSGNDVFVYDSQGILLAVNGKSVHSEANHNVHNYHLQRPYQAAQMNATPHSQTSSARVPSMMQTPQSVTSQMSAPQMMQTPTALPSVYVLPSGLIIDSGGVILSQGPYYGRVLAASDLSQLQVYQDPNTGHNAASTGIIGDTLVQMIPVIYANSTQNGMAVVSPASVHANANYMSNVSPATPAVGMYNGMSDPQMLLSDNFNKAQPIISLLPRPIAPAFVKSVVTAKLIYEPGSSYVQVIPSDGSVTKKAHKRLLCDFFVRSAVDSSASATKCSKGHKCSYYHPGYSAPNGEMTDKICRDYLLGYGCSRGKDCNAMHPCGRISIKVALQLGLAEIQQN